MLLMRYSRSCPETPLRAPDRLCIHTAACSVQLPSSSMLVLPSSMPATNLPSHRPHWHRSGLLARGSARKVHASQVKTSVPHAQLLAGSAVVRLVAWPDSTWRAMRHSRMRGGCRLPLASNGVPSSGAAKDALIEMAIAITFAITIGRATARSYGRPRRQTNRCRWPRGQGGLRR